MFFAQKLFIMVKEYIKLWGSLPLLLKIPGVGRKSGTPLPLLPSLASSLTSHSKWTRQAIIKLDTDEASFLSPIPSTGQDKQRRQTRKGNSLIMSLCWVCVIERLPCAHRNLSLASVIIVCSNNIVSAHSWRIYQAVVWRMYRTRRNDKWGCLVCVTMGPVLWTQLRFGIHFHQKLQ